MKKVLLIVLSLLLVLNFTGCKKKSKKTKEEGFSVVDTTWVTALGDEYTFLENEIKLSRDEGTEFETYFYGEYKLFVGEDALNYLTDDLKEYNISKKDIVDLIENNEKYTMDNFVVFDIRYAYGLDNGEKYDMDGALIPMYGFIVNDGKEFELINMNANSSLKLTKKD